MQRENALMEDMQAFDVPVFSSSYLVNLALFIILHIFVCFDHLSRTRVIILGNNPRF